MYLSPSATDTRNKLIDNKFTSEQLKSAKRNTRRVVVRLSNSKAFQPAYEKAVTHERTDLNIRIQLFTRRELNPFSNATLFYVLLKSGSGTF